MKTRKVSLYPQTLILTMLFLAINFSKPLKPRSTKCFPSVSHLVLSTVLPPLLIQTKKCQMNTVWVHGESGVQWVYLSISLPQAGLLILNYNKISAQMRMCSHWYSVQLILGVLAPASA